MHRALGHALQERTADGQVNRARAREVVRDALEHELRADGPPVLLENEETEDDLKEQSARMLDAVLEDLPMPDEVLGVEVGFQVELHHPETREPLPVPLVGSIDAVVRDGREIRYVELKSAKRRWSDDQVTYDLQLTAYGVAMRRFGHPNAKPRLVVVTKARLPVVQLESPYRGWEHERDLEATAASVLRATRAGVDHPVRSWACKTCPFAGACR
jgi:predicted RecB family nuclease